MYCPNGVKNHACIRLDPVTDPAYNMKEIIKQLVLLEDHLINRKKRCPDCISKHFLTIIALQEEAMSLAGPNRNRYPLMGDNLPIFQQLFDQWVQKRNTPEGERMYLEIAGHLRQRRKALVAKYILH